MNGHPIPSTAEPAAYRGNEPVVRPTIVWLRDDLRLADNPALNAAAERGAPVIVLYVLDDVSDEVRPLGAASRWWLHGSLVSLGASITKLGGQLVCRRGAAETVIPQLVAETHAAAVYWNRRYGRAREVDARLKALLRGDGIDARSFQANVLFEPWAVTTGQGGPYRVFTPFWRACQSLPIREPLDLWVPEWASAASDDIDDWELLPTRLGWAAGLRESWNPGEASAHERLDAFIEQGLELYHRRDEPGIDATSRLSPHLRFGEISAFQIWRRIHGQLSPAARANVAKFASEVGWREFNTHILFHAPHLATRNYRPAFDAFVWGEPNPEELEAWQRGSTGIPLVDAGMRELWHTGTMHNRVRMVTASFLIKNLLVDWRVGEQWFWDTLVDADEASNPGNWQWVAGSGADAAPYFRIFNPVLQQQKFDKAGTYVERWVPEWLSPEYPAPIVDLGQSRREALAAYDAVKAASNN